MKTSKSLRAENVGDMLNAALAADAPAREGESK